MQVSQSMYPVYYMPQQPAMDPKELREQNYQQFIQLNPMLAQQYRRLGANPPGFIVSLVFWILGLCGLGMVMWITYALSTNSMMFMVYALSVNAFTLTFLII